MGFSRENNTIDIFGELTNTDLFRTIAAMHKITTQQGYKDVFLDFSECKKAYSVEMMAICAKCQSYWKSGIDIALTLPIEHDLARLFKNTNWAHLIDPRKYDESRFRGYTHAPTIRFSNGKEQYEAVNKILDVLLAAISHFRRQDLQAIEWSINEITDNVINHSQSNVGGFIQLTNHRHKSQIEFVVCDSGIGVPGSLRPTHPDLRTDSEALDSAIREGVTRDKSVGQGNGLYGTWTIAQKSLGQFKLSSGHATLNSSEKDGLRIQSHEIPMSGTLIACRIGYHESIDLKDALVFSGKAHTPIDYVENHFETGQDGSAIFDLAAESTGFGSRSAGEPVRRKIANLIRLSENGRVAVDLSSVPLTSSSYADEVFGKLFLELGPLEFSRCIEFKNVDSLVRSLIDKAIMQRMRQ